MTKAENPSHKIAVKGKYLAAIENYISTLVLDSGLIVQWNPELEVLQEAIAKLQARFLTTTDVVSIIIHECMDFRAAHQDRTGALSDPSNEDLKSELIERIKRFIESLPRNYLLRIGLPSFPVWRAETYTISDELKIVVNDVEPRPTNAVVNALMGIKFDALSRAEFGPIKDKHNVYVEFLASGYSQFSLDSPAMSECLSLAKQFAFILTTHGICKNDYSSIKAIATLTDTDSKKSLPLLLPDSIARSFARLALDEVKLLTYDHGAPFFLGVGRPATTTDEKVHAFNVALNPLVRFYQAKDHADFQSISAAIEWHQDSIFADNQTFAYVAACIGLEALLGSENNIDNMSKRLADRYAFLLGKGRKEREQMVEEYGKVLKLRGKLVHGKLARLEGEDRKLLYAAQAMLLNAIWHELHAMYKDKDAQEQGCRPGCNPSD